MTLNTVLKTSPQHIVRPLVLCILCVLTVEHLGAQLKGPKYDERLLFRGMTGITVGGSQQEWTLKDRGKFLQQSVSAVLSVPISNRILLTVSNSPGIAKSDTMKLQGIADTRVAFSYVVPGDRVWINGGVSLPTGVTKLTESQLGVASIISQSALAYRVPVFGQGTNANLGFAYAFPAQRRLIVGLGASVLYKGEYQPSSITGLSDKYDPGDEISVNGGFDYTTFSKSSRLSADVTVTNYFPDKLNGENFIQSGLRVMAVVVYSLKWGETAHLVQFRTRQRTQSQIYSSGVSEKFKSSQHYEFQYTASWFPMKWCSLSGLLEGKMYTGDQIPLGIDIFETGTATLASGGVEAGLAVFSSLSVSLNAKYGTGSVVIDNVKNTATGIEFGGGMRLQF